MTITAEQLAELAAAIQERIDVAETYRYPSEILALHRANLEHVTDHQYIVDVIGNQSHIDALKWHTRRLMAVYLEETNNEAQTDL